MYDHRRSGAPVRDPAPRYGAGGLDRFPADEVLADLSAAEGAEATARIPRVLARYAALRAILLRWENAPAALTGHARDGALAHVAAVVGESGEDGWEEGELLLRALDAEPGDAATLLAAAAGEAARVGEAAGAGALRDAARRATLIQLGLALRRHPRRN